MVNAENLSAQEASAQQGAWLPQENVYEEWPQGAGSPSCEGPQAADPVIFAHSAAQKKKQIEPPSMSGSFFYVVHAEGRIFRPAAPKTRRIGHADPFPDLSGNLGTAAGRPRRAIYLPFRIRRGGSAPGHRPASLSQKSKNASDFWEQNT